MTITEAKNMLEAAHFQTHQPQVWADLGCGSGTFTYALANLLAAQSKIFAVDSTNQVLDTTISNIDIEFVRADFSQGLSLKNLDGILMANSLHFIKDKMSLIDSFKQSFKEHPQYLIVEYDTASANPWVPYPIKYDELQTLFPVEAYSIEKIGERRSIYHQNMMYAAAVKRRR